MKNIKKILTAMLLASIIAAPIEVLADIPEGTAVVGEYAYDLEYFNQKENFKEISAILQKYNYDIKVKTFTGKWIDNLSGKTIGTEAIPKVTYKDAKGVATEYEEKDGKKIEEIKKEDPVTPPGGGGGGIIPPPSGGGGGGSIPPVVDTVKPVITLKGEKEITLTVGDKYTDAGVTASDDKDGDITSKVTTIIKNSKGVAVPQVDTSKADTYTVEYNVSDAAGNKADLVKRTVIVKEKPPVLVNKVEVIVDGYKVKVKLSGNLRGQVAVKITSKKNGSVEFLGQGSPINNVIEFDTLIEKSGDFILEYTAFNGEESGIYDFTIKPTLEEKVQISVENSRATITVKSETLNPVVTWRVLNKGTGALECAGQGETVGNIYEGSTKVLKKGSYILEINVLSEGTISKEFQI